MHSFDASDKRDDAVYRDDVTVHGVIVALAIPVIAAIVVYTETLRKRSRIVMCYDLLLRTRHGCLP